MIVEIQVNNSLQPAARYVTWAWSPCLARISNPAGMIGTQVVIQLSQAALAGGGAIRFSNTASGAGSTTLNVTLPRSGTSVPFFIRGTTASNADPGVQINARQTTSKLVLGSAALMVRIRKSVTSLTPPERDRLLSALATLNNQGLGRYADFAGTHVQAGRPEAHGLPGFLPWHRAFVLDLERELQAIDRSVTLPYWRFDLPAAALFSPDFLGNGSFQGPGTNAVVFSATNPLRFWKAGPTPGIFRDPGFNVNAAPPAPMGQAAALLLGNQGALYKNFRRLESVEPRDYHGDAHTSFSGPIDSIPTAAQDPLFFFLHCNVDHAWALWQKQNARLNPATAASFETMAPPARIGHKLGDTMWPWNGDTNPPRPNFALGGTMAPSPCVGAPGPKPRVQDVFDYQGSVALVNNLGFSYDDVPL